MNQRITSITYGRTINVGNYESVRIDLTARVDAGEDWHEVLKDLKGELLKLEKRSKEEGF